MVQNFHYKWRVWILDIRYLIKLVNVLAYSSCLMFYLLLLLDRLNSVRNLISQHFNFFSHFFTFVRADRLLLFIVQHGRYRILNIDMLIGYLSLSCTCWSRWSICIVLCYYMVLYIGTVFVIHLNALFMKNL